MEKVVDHLVTSLKIPLGCHMSDSFEDDEFELVAQSPNATTVLSAIQSCGVPRSPILLSGKL